MKSTNLSYLGPSYRNFNKERDVVEQVIRVGSIFLANFRNELRG